MKRCGRCGLAKGLEEFHRRGSSGRQAWCKPCRATYDHNYHATTQDLRLEQKRLRRLELVAWHRELKARLPCADCGESFHHAAMHWDHRPGTIKRFDVSHMIKSYSRRAILDEIAKCDLVCANCHAVRTYTRQRDVAQPG
jgi:hypothetical protein